MQIWLQYEREEGEGPVYRKISLANGTNISALLELISAEKLIERQIHVGDYDPSQSFDVKYAVGVYSYVHSGHIPGVIKNDGKFNPDLLYEVVTQDIKRASRAIENL